MKRFILTLCFLCCHPLMAQDVLKPGKKPSPVELKDASDLLERAKAAPAILKVGGYCFVELEKDLVLNWYVPPGSADLLKRTKMAPGETYEGFLIPKDKTAFEFITIPASTKLRYRLTATKPGRAQLLLLGNGATLNDPPVVVEAYDFIIGDAPPDDPITPVAPAGDLAKLAQADIKAGRGTQDNAKAYVAWLAKVSKNVEASESFKTYGEFYKSLSDGADTLAGPYDSVLPTMRKEVTKILTETLGGRMGDPFPIETRRKVSSALAGIVERLKGL